MSSRFDFGFYSFPVSWFRQTKLIGDNGYAYETHHVTTVDGYILELHRIPSTGGRPVILMHGLLDSSAAWVMSGRQNGFGMATNLFRMIFLFCSGWLSLCGVSVYPIRIAYILSNSGYDVWLGNCRGNIYSQQHKQYEANGRHWDRKRFWNFSWHEIGVCKLENSILWNWTSLVTSFAPQQASTICQQSLIMCRRKRITRNFITSAIHKAWQHSSWWHPNDRNTMRNFSS